LGITISPGNLIENTGDTNPFNDITDTTPAGGDLSGTYPSPKVVQIQTRPVLSTAPSSGEVLKWNGSAWAPGTDSVNSPIWELESSIAYYDGKVAIGTDTSSTHQLQIYGDNNALRLFGTEGDYKHGAQINFGDLDNVFLKEYKDDELQIRATKKIWIYTDFLIFGPDTLPNFIMDGEGRTGVGSLDTYTRLTVHSDSTDDYIFKAEKSDGSTVFSIDKVGFVHAYGRISADTVHSFGDIIADDEIIAFGDGYFADDLIIVDTLFAGSGGSGTLVLKGDLDITGDLSKGSGSFKIDHPLDPANKYLYHSFVESPDMMNVYNGNIRTNSQGFAEVSLPTYFMTLNKDFRYQLTVIGTFAQAIVKEKISNNRFVIQTNVPNVEVSWQVTGIRQDNFAEKNRIQVEVDKTPEERGTYLHPDAFEQATSRKVRTARRDISPLKKSIKNVNEK